MSFDKNKIGEIRPNQLITTFGPGAIIDAVKDSVTVLDTNYWTEKGKKIIDGRLASYLGVSYFYMPQTSKNGDLPVVSFPYYHVCSNPKCGCLFDIRDNFDAERYKIYGPTCPECHKMAYPSRFIVMCEKGHMDDFPWDWWTHKGTAKGHKKFRMYSTGNTSTLADMWVECLECGEKRSMSGATQEEAFYDKKCSGKHPFRPNLKGEKCTAHVIPSQRGASNVYFPVIRSAISIPPWTDPLYNLIDEHLRLLDQMIEMKVPDAETMIYNTYFSANYSREAFDKALAKRRMNIKEFNEIKLMEYLAITHHDDPAYASNKKHFKAEEDVLPRGLAKSFSRVIKITRLRDVMVLLGFTRTSAPDPDAEQEQQVNIVKLNKSRNEPWLPAVEVNGEGLFVEFNKDSINQWLSKPSVKMLSKQYEFCYEQYCLSRGWTQNFKKNAKYVLMHTFAHLLIKEMSLQSGYSSSSIKERIYCGDDMCGVLLYTGSSDKEGSLGGLVELGNYDKLIPLIKSAFENALICTNDPECMESNPTVEKSNGAACHSCCMISETACENGNRLLDRTLVVPIGDKSEQSYFKELVEELCCLEI